MKQPHLARLQIGTFEVDWRSGDLHAGDRKTVLQEQPLQVLRLLAEAGGDLVTREEIRKKLWPNDTIVEFDHSINAAIMNLRRALGDSAEEPKYIETIVRRGYRLLVPVKWISADESVGGVSAAVGGAAVRLQPDTGLLGKKVSHYRVLEIIGGGGMGLVYKAEDLKLGRQVALKFLPEELASDPVALQRFEREARTASSLDHANVCTIYEVEEHAGEPFIVMQLLRGETLRDRLAELGSANEKLPLEKLLDVAVQVCSGLEAAHAKGIIHRDIKPANIFLTSSGQVKILDFGLAKEVVGEPERIDNGVVPIAEVVVVPEQTIAPAGVRAPEIPEQTKARPLGKIVDKPDATLTRFGVALGTAGYMSPEQIRGDKLDARTDIFSFGLVLYEMATGQRAFGGQTEAIQRAAILAADPVPAHELNSALPPRLCEIIGKALEKDRDHRYQAAFEMRADLLEVKGTAQSGGISPLPRAAWRRLKSPAMKIVWRIAVPILLVAASVEAGLYYHARQAERLTDKDTVVLADFANSTGETVFDHSLRTALGVSLRQSPFLNLLSDRAVTETLQLMTRPADTKLTPELTREVCVRTGSKAYIAGAIASLGNEYALWLNAVNCHSGDTLAQEQVTAASKGSVLEALGKAATSLRVKLGESLPSVQKFDTPLPKTTSSLEALQAYGIAIDASLHKGEAEAIPPMKRAIELDPNFAIAYAVLGSYYTSAGQERLGTEYAKKAYDLREHLSEAEKFSVSYNYYGNGIGDAEKAAQVTESWVHAYPNSKNAYLNLAVSLATIGQWEKALAAGKESLRLQPTPNAFGATASAYMALNRFDEAETLLEQSSARKLDTDEIHQLIYSSAFLRGDSAGMQQQLTWAAQHPGTQYLFLPAQASTEAYYGRMKKARDLLQRAISSALRADLKENAARLWATQALWEAEFGNTEQARSAAEEALRIGSGTSPPVEAAIALARAKQADKAEKLAERLEKEFPSATDVHSYYLPILRAYNSLTSHDAEHALELLQPATEYDLADAGPLYPAYARGLAFLMEGKGIEAAAEFRKLIDHPGIVVNSPLGALAHLQIGRAYAMTGDTAKAKAAYQDFLTLWKDADPDIPIYKQAKAEYAKLA